MLNKLQRRLPLAVLKLNSSLCYITYCKTVATVLTACGMRRGVRESREQSVDEVRTSLVPDYKEGKTKRMEWKYLLFTVLKRFQSILNEDFSYVATALTACGIETLPLLYDVHKPLMRCNSTYRLRYWNLSGLEPAYVELENRCNSAYRLRYWNFLQRRQMVCTSLP